MNQQLLYEHLKKKIRLIVRERGRKFNSIWLQLVLERFLVRVALSEHRERFIFKGGMLLGQYVSLGRETVDLDFLLKKIDKEKDNFEEMIKDIIFEQRDDDFNFKFKAISDIDHQSTHYFGYNVSLTAHFAKTVTPVSVDIGVGDMVGPNRMDFNLITGMDGPLFENSVELLVYPPEFIFAEKFETIIFREGRNSRMKDFYDLVMLIENMEFDKHQLSESIKKTFKDRQTPLKSVVEYKQKHAIEIGGLWRSFTNKISSEREKERLKDFNHVLLAINSFLNELDLK